MVGPDGIEPSTSPLSGVRSSHLSYGPRCGCLHCRPNTGGAGRDRTGDLLSANQALSQLSYSPFSGWRSFLRSAAFEINRGQLDTGIGNIKPPTSFRFTPICFKWRSGSVLTINPRFNPKNQWRFMEWNDCPLLAHAVHSSASGFQKLHPRSLLERR